MATNMTQLDSTSSDSFEVSFDSAEPAAPVDSPEAPPEPDPSPDLAQEGDDWVDEVEAAPEEPQVEGEAETSVEEPGDETSLQTVSVDVRGKQHEFKLDPSDDVLRRTLRDGVRAKKIRAENKRLRDEFESGKATYEQAAEAKSVFDELSQLTSEGEYDRVVQAVLGDQYEEFLESKLEEFISYQEASPEERARIDAERAAKSATYAERAKEKKIQELENRLKERDERVEDQRYHSYATNALQKHALGEDEISDPDLRNRLNKRLWVNAWESMKKVSKTRDLTPQVINKVFEHEAKLSRYGINKSSDKRTQEAVENKKKVAEKQAATIATSQYPQKESPVVGDLAKKWDGKSSFLDFYKASLRNS